MSNSIADTLNQIAVISGSLTGRPLSKSAILSKEAMELRDQINKRYQDELLTQTSSDQGSTQKECSA